MHALKSWKKHLGNIFHDKPAYPIFIKLKAIVYGDWKEAQFYLIVGTIKPLVS